MSDRRGENNPNYRGGTDTVVCKNCGEVFSAYDRIFCSVECYREFSKGENHPRYSDLITVDCSHCGESFEKKEYRVKERQFCSDKCHNAWMSENNSGEDSPRWEGGHENYYGDNWNQVREKARTVVGECQICGGGPAPREHLDIHHIVPVQEFEQPEDANNLQNLTALCRTCHVAVENDERDTPVPLSELV